MFRLKIWALVTFLLLVLVGVGHTIEQATLIPALQDPSPANWLWWFVNTLVLIPLPVLLFFLYRDGRDLEIPAGLAPWALIAGAVKVTLQLPGLYRLAEKLSGDMSHLSDFGGTTIAENLRMWFGAGGVSVWPWAGVLSQLAFGSFLIVLSCQKRSTPDSSPLPYRIRETAALSLCVSLMTMVLGGMLRIYSSFKSSEFGENPWYSVATGLPMWLVPELIRATVALVVFKSRHPAPADTENPTAETAIVTDE